ncbi:MAG: pilus assembly protein PilO [Gammaproteobacteria bacterium]|jgi:type IV pilus assembly protein PilO|nr:MAG: pilus assembly protein PilO [Gammaproteobacteria bacterium]
MKNILNEIKNLDPNNPGLWPILYQLVVAVIVFAAILYAGWHFDVSKQRETLAGEETKEQELKTTFETKQRKAANLDALKEQMKEMEQSFGDMIRQLPNKTEIAGLIVDVSQTGLAAGLEFDLFQPQPEKQSEFYSETPINIQVRGTYHQLGEFISGVAALPRIVTTHDIKIALANANTGGNVLSMTAVAKTYRALEEEEG